MKKLVVENEIPTIPLSEVDLGQSIIAYKQQNNRGTRNRWAYSILHRLHMDYRDKEWYGFCSLYHTAGAPTYVANTWEDSAKKCANSRDVRVFESVHDLMSAIMSESF